MKTCSAECLVSVEALSHCQWQKNPYTMVHVRSFSISHLYHQL